MDHQAAGADIFAEGIHRRQSVLRKEVGDLAAPGQQHQIGCDQNAVGPDIIELLQSSFDLAGAADAENIEGDVQLLRGPMEPITTGIELVACLAATAAGVPWVTIKSTGSAVSSTAMAGKRSS